MLTEGNMSFLQGLGTWVQLNIDFPAVILMLILVLGLWVVHKTQANPNNNFDFTDMLRDEKGKPSTYRLAIFVCLAVSTWAVMYMAIATEGKLDTWIFAWYITVWSGAKVAEKGIEAYASSRTQTSGNGFASAPRPAISRPVSYPIDDDFEDGADTKQGGLNAQLPPEYKRPTK